MADAAARAGQATGRITSARGSGDVHDGRDDELEALVRERLGFRTLRTGQAEAILAGLHGRDVLAVLPTGGGKSAIYQVLASVRDGVTVVISPLLALQHDQVGAIEELALGGAVALNASMSNGAREEAIESLGRGELAFVFVAPEQLVNSETLDALTGATVGCLVVDEAHCISAWGHDFRPDYLRLPALIEAMGRPQVVALTATASPTVRTEIVDGLGMEDPAVIVAAFDRPNLHLAVEHIEDADERDDAVVARVHELAADGSCGIVYVATRARAEHLAERCGRPGTAVEPYHAGLGARRREEVQEAFMSGTVGVVVATTAFGMGIDKPDVRFVVHADVPESVDSLYQEIGRAGRDGEPATTVLFHRQADLGLRRFQVGGGPGDEDDLRDVAALLESARRSSIDALVDELDRSRRRVVRAVDRLQAVDAVLVDAAGEVVLEAGDLAARVEVAIEQAEHRRARDASRVKMIRGYAELRSCRRRFLLGYFGEEAPDDCGQCDICDSGRGSEPVADGPWAVGDHVGHVQWGRGQVVLVDDGTLTVLFESVGYRTLAADLVEEHGLLEQIDPDDGGPEPIRPEPIVA